MIDKKRSLWWWCPVKTLLELEGQFYIWKIIMWELALKDVQYTGNQPFVLVWSNENWTVSYEYGMLWNSEILKQSSH